MKHSRRIDIFKQVRAEHTGFLTSVLWKLTGDRELFAEALQYALLGIWQNIEKLNSKKAGAYIYRIALSANSKAWRTRIGRNGQIGQAQIISDKGPAEEVGESELEEKVRLAVSQLPAKQARAIVMRYFEQKEYGDIAGKLRCSEAGARSHVSKALATLKTRFATLAKREQYNERRKY
ncbi:MAG: RNA polymerase sigma factor [Planctomycetota bacterium]|jgi:RNA polymerase sigma factor (sigma-70 family)